MGEPVRVKIVAPDPVLEAGTKITLHGSADIALVSPGEVAAVTIVIVDQVNSQVLEALRSTRTDFPRSGVVLVATDLEPVEALDAIAAGACGLLRRREANTVRLVRAVLAAADSDCTVPPDLLRRLLEHRSDNERTAPTASNADGSALSMRERAVLKLVADGHETVEIARRLAYSTRTVTSILHDITHRFRLRNRAHAVAFALRAGLL